MFLINIFESMPLIVFIQWPAIYLINVLRLPYFKKPSVTVFKAGLDFLTKSQSTFHGFLNKTFARIAFHHSRSHFSGGDNTVMRRGGGLHHIGFIKGFFINITFNMNHGCL